MGIKVRAIQKGYYNHVRVAVGKDFPIKDEEAFSKEWMVKVSKKDESVVKEPEAPREAVRLSPKAMHQGKIDQNIGKQEDFSGDETGTEPSEEVFDSEPEAEENVEETQESTGNQKVI